jgi:predicted Rossmann-fold nucleotide-binding protein
MSYRETEDQARARLAASVNRPGAVRVLVCGGRHFGNASQLGACLGGIARDRGIACIIEGGAGGADKLARRFGEWGGIPVESYPADWETQGLSAGPMRNARMLEEGCPDLIVAFAGGKGTANMVAQARKGGFQVLEVDP